MKLKVISDGRCWGTKIVNADTGEMIDGVFSAVWECDVEGDSIATLTLKVCNVDIEAVGEVEETTAFGDTNKSYKRTIKQSTGKTSVSRKDAKKAARVK